MPRAAKEGRRVADRVKRAAQAGPGRARTRTVPDRASSDLDARSDATHSRQRRAGVLFNPCPGCHTASAGFGAEPQEKGEALNVSSFGGREREGFWMENSQ